MRTRSHLKAKNKPVRAKKLSRPKGGFEFLWITPNQALSTFPERRHLVQTYTLLGEPLTIALTLLTLGFQVLFERLCEWETLIPKVISFPQYSHFAISEHLLVNFERINIIISPAKMQAFFI